MAEPIVDIDSPAFLQGLLGYLNYSDGKPDPRWQKQLNDVFRILADRHGNQAWNELRGWLGRQLDALRAGGAKAFQEVAQAKSVIALVYEVALPAYRRHHADLLGHLGDAELCQPFLLARLFETVLAQGPPWDERDRIAAGALQTLNDYVGHRPIAILETRPRGEPYDHERVRPIPLYLRSAGVAHGKFHDILTEAIKVLAEFDDDLLSEAGFDIELLDELAVDPRAYDHGHPYNRRPNYVFGEWDPHHLDNEGRFRRFVVRQVILDGLLERIERGTATQPVEAGSALSKEFLHEAASVFAVTLLMAAGTTGRGPGSQDSTVTLATLVPTIARFRDACYAELLQTIRGQHGERLRLEAGLLRQPFGGVRQHLNHYLARHRAWQLQRRCLSLLYAEMGQADASRRQAGLIHTASVRMIAEIRIRLAAARLHIEQGELPAAADSLSEIEDLFHRGIACGALADPWNILGFQGQYPLMYAPEDSLRDPRIDELVDAVEQTLLMHARLMAEASAAGNSALSAAARKPLARLGRWWDQFASAGVSDVKPVVGKDIAESAEGVASALADWHARGEATGDLAFWKKHLKHLRGPRAYAQVVEGLLRRNDFRAALALLMNWLGHAADADLEDGADSFHLLAIRWLLAVTTEGQKESGDGEKLALVRRFFDYLEANAEDLWQPPKLGLEVDTEADAADEDDADSLYSAAYEDVTYKDSTDDDVEGSVADGGPPPEGEFELEAEEKRLEQHLRFLSTVAKLWQIAARCLPAPPWGRGVGGEGVPLAASRAKARENERGLLALLDALHEFPIPAPLGGHDSMVEYDSRRGTKDRLLYLAISTCMDTITAVRALDAAIGEPEAGDSAAWHPLAVRLEQALLHGDADGARAALPEFLERFKSEPLLFVPTADGGHPRQVLRSRLAITFLQFLAEHLPRLGLLRESYDLLTTARAMEQGSNVQGRRVTEFDRLYHLTFQTVCDTVVDSSRSWDAEFAADARLVELLDRLTEPFLKLWVEHSRSLHLSVVESVGNEEQWKALKEFVQRYGTDLMPAKFMTLGNLRGVLHRGAGEYLDYLKANADPLHPVKLIEELDQGLPREGAVLRFQVILQLLVENYEEFRDYNTTTAHSDYGENLYMLFDFLRLKTSYERHAWQVRPLLFCHEVLARRDRPGAALLWQEMAVRYTKEFADQHLAELARLEQTHGIRLRSLTERLEDRFVKPLAVDRLCALIGPALPEPGKPPPSQEFARLERAIEEHAETPTGTGLDIPAWLRRLEQEVQRLRQSRSALGSLAETSFRVPRRPLGYEEVRKQLDAWLEQGNGTEKAP